MPPTLTISVAIATFHGERYLRQQLESIAKQTLLPLEVVITDDQSSDGTLEVAESFGQQAPFPVRCFRNETRLRYADNFLRAASLCQGDLIAFCDQDDLWLENKLSTCAAHFQDETVQLVCHSAQTITGDGQPGYFFPHLKTRTLRRGTCNPLENQPGFVMVFRRSLLSLLLPENRPARLYGHDHWAWFLACLTGTVVKLSDVLCYYRQHENNVYGATANPLSRKVRTAMEVPRYLELAEAEADCSRFLLDNTETLPEAWKRPAQNMAEKLASRSALHRLRFTLYESGKGLLARSRTYARILFSGGYLPDLSKSRLGPKAALKDLVMAVFGARKVLNS